MYWSFAPGSKDWIMCVSLFLWCTYYFMPHSGRLQAGLTACSSSLVGNRNCSGLAVLASRLKVAYALTSPFYLMSCLIPVLHKALYVRLSGSLSRPNLPSSPHVVVAVLQAVWL